jgi:nodulation protein E
VLGTAGGGVNTWDENYRAVYEEGKNRVHPFVVPKLMNNAAASHLSMEFNLNGPRLHRGHGLRQFQSRDGAGLPDGAGGRGQGDADGRLGIHAVLRRHQGLGRLRVMSKDACRPFSLNRNGMVQGEGAAVFVFEDYDHARARGAEILAEVAGFAMTSDASDIVMPSKQGAARAMPAPARRRG